MRLPSMIKEQRRHPVEVQRPTQLQQRLLLSQLLRLYAVAIPSPAGRQLQHPEQL